MGIGITQTKGFIRTDFTHTDPTGSSLDGRPFAQQPSSPRASISPTRSSQFEPFNNSTGSPNNNNLDFLNADIIDPLQSFIDLLAGDLSNYLVLFDNSLINEIQSSSSPPQLINEATLQNQLGAPNNNDLNDLNFLNADIIDLLESSEDLLAEDLSNYLVLSDNSLINEIQPSFSPPQLINEAPLQNQRGGLKQTTALYLDINRDGVEDHRKHSTLLSGYSGNKNNLSSSPLQTMSKNARRREQRDRKAQAEGYPNYAARQRADRDRQAQARGYSDNAALQRDQRAKKAQELGRDAYLAKERQQRDRRAQQRNFLNDSALQRAQTDKRAQKAGYSDNAARLCARRKAQIQKLGHDTCAAKQRAQRDRKAQAEGFPNDAARRRARRALAKQQKQKATQQDVVSEMWSAEVIVKHLFSRETSF